MERPTYHSPYHKALEHLQDGLTVEICNDFDRNSHLLLSLGEIATKYDVNTESLHPETVRALCIYASIAAGELTDSNVRYYPDVTRLHGEGYDQKSVTSSEFLVTPRAQPPIVKRGVTYEDRPSQNNHGGSGGAPAIRNHPRSTSVPGFVNRITNRRGF